jgi:hypothetical protein
MSGRTEGGAVESFPTRIARMTAETDAAEQYFTTIAAALAGLEIFMRDDRSPLYRHGIVAKIAASYIGRLEKSFSCWRNRLGFVETFKISRAESGFPVYQNVLELENDRRQANQRLASIPEANEIRNEMADFILRHKAYPEALQRQMAERLYLEDVKDGNLFSPFMLAETAKVSVNPKTYRPYYLVHWATFDGSANLPLIYMVTVEDSSEAMIAQLVGQDGKLNDKLDIPLPVDGLLNPELAHRFDDFTEKNSAYSLSPATIAINLDKDFEPLHPKQMRRVVLGPFYSAGITENNSTVTQVLSRVRKPENAWLLTWTIQEVFSKNERAGRKGLWSSEKATQEFFIDTDDLEAARQGVSSYEKHALIPHEAYQALYAAGEAQKIFEGYKVHILSKGQVISDV